MPQIERDATIRPGSLIYDTGGRPLNAHGAGVLHWQGRYYLFGECRPPGPASQNATIGVSCYSSENFTEWRNEGVVLSVMPEGSAHELEAGCKIERPKVLFSPKDSRFVMWFHHDRRGWGHAGALAGIAVSDSPTGPFVFQRSVRPNGCMFRDFTLFQDADQTAYAIFATDDNANLAICELDDSYLGATHRCHRFFPGRYMEAPCVFQREGIYYLIASDCSGWHPNEARSAWAPTVFGPWKEMGNPCLGEGAELTFGSQSTFVARLEGKDPEWVFMADQWRPENLCSSPYVWLPISFRKTVPFDPPRPFITWTGEWAPRAAGDRPARSLDSP